MVLNASADVYEEMVDKASVKVSTVLRELAKELEKYGLSNATVSSSISLETHGSPASVGAVSFTREVGLEI